MIVVGLILIGVGQIAAMMGLLAGVVMHEPLARRRSYPAIEQAVRKAVSLVVIGAAIFVVGLLLALAGVTHT